MRGTSREPGDVLTRVVSDTARLRVGLKGVLVHVLQHGLFLLGVSVVLLALDVWLGLAYLAGLGVAIGVALVGTDRAAAMARLRRGRESRVVNDALRAATSGQGLIARPTDRERSVAILTQVKGRTAWAVQGLLGVTACLVLTLAVQFTETGRLDTADLALVSSYLLMLHYPMMRLGRQITRLGPQLTSAERLAGLAEPPTPNAAEAQMTPKAARAVLTASPELPGETPAEIIAAPDHASRVDAARCGGCARVRRRAAGGLPHAGRPPEESC